jgi:hypothetical protein
MLVAHVLNVHIFLHTENTLQSAHMTIIKATQKRS